jgi:hypothetical protein
MIFWKSFFGLCELCDCHSALCLVVSGSYWKHHVSFPVMIQNICSHQVVLSYFHVMQRVWHRLHIYFSLIQVYVIMNLIDFLFTFSLLAIILSASWQSLSRKLYTSSTSWRLFLVTHCKGHLHIHSALLKMLKPSKCALDRALSPVCVCFIGAFPQLYTKLDVDLFRCMFLSARNTRCTKHGHTKQLHSPI